ncbi:MAG: RluA family pseudouridine synthase [Myxococcaceae bacterium]|nr:RluA family pseudouridine synthase [Myxococcaceae bacterium]
MAEEFPHSTREVWAERIARGELTDEGVVLAADAPLFPGQWLTWSRPPWEEPPVPLHCQELYRDAHLLAVSKPSGLPVMPAGGYLEHTLMALVQRGAPDARPVHRLGRGTSGLVLFSLNTPAHRALSAAMRSHGLSKRYLGLASGTLTAPAVFEAPIGPVPHARLGTVHAASPAGSPSCTRLERAEPRGADTLAELELVTGRPHQIRIHLAHAGHPLVGDPLYLPGGALADALPGDEGYLLHAWRLSLAHPVTGAALELEAPVPAGLT